MSADDRRSRTEDPSGHIDAANAYAYDAITKAGHLDPGDAAPVYAQAALAEAIAALAAAIYARAKR